MKKIKVLSLIIPNDPFLGDQFLAFPSSHFTLGFDDAFSVGAGNRDGFYIKLFNADKAAIIQEFFGNTVTPEEVRHGYRPSLPCTANLQKN